MIGDGRPNQSAALVNPYLTFESAAEPHNSSFRYKGGTVRHVHDVVWTDSYTTGKREGSAGKKCVGTGTVKRDLDDVALRIVEVVKDVWVGKQLRGIEVTVGLQRCNR